MKERVFIDMDGVLANFEKALGGQPASTMKGRKGFFLNLEPIEGAIAAFHTLSDHYDVRILSTPSWGNPDCWGEKRLWVERHLGEKAFKKLILSHDKSLFSGKYLIDDRTANGADGFQGEHVHFGQAGLESWDKVLRHVLKN